MTPDWGIKLFTVPLRLTLISPPTWLLVALIHVLFIVLGLALIPWQSGYTTIENGKMQFRAWWMWLYCNPEDDIQGSRAGEPAQKWWMDRTAGMTVRQRIYAWSARRNPANNLRYVPFLAPLFRPARIGAIGTGDEPPDGQWGWAYVWQGIYSGLYIKTPWTWFWLGWKFRSSDANGVDPADTRLPRCDFAMQLQLTTVGRARIAQFRARVAQLWARLTRRA